MSRRALLVLVAIAAVVVVLPIVTARDDGTRVGATPVERVLIVSMPGVAWDDVDPATMPALRAFADRAAVADVSTRIGRRSASITDAYLTIGAGTRAEAPSTDTAVALDPADRYGGVSTTAILERRLGIADFTGIAYLGVGAARNRNERSAYGATVGLLGVTLAEAGVGRAVIGNADAIGEPPDENQPPPDGYYVRSAATALMDEAGIVPEGVVGRGLLRDDDAAPYGVELDPGAVRAAFDTVWTGRQVVLVEASDLSRVATYESLATREQRATMRADALRHADELLADLLDAVDPTSDAVIVVSPTSPDPDPALGLVAVAAPGIDGGWLTSPTTRRAGYVLLADLGPTVASLVGASFPSEVEGRSFHTVDAGSGRVAALVDAADAARFRDDFLPLLVTVLIVILVALSGMTIWRTRLPDVVTAAIVPGAYAVLGAVIGSYVAGQFSASRADALGHWAVIVIGAAALAVVGLAADRHRTRSGVLVVPAVTMGVLLVDVLTGANLQVNTMFGYSMAVAGRFTGLGNLAYALLGAAALAVAGVSVARWGRAALPGVAALLVLVVAIDGLPMLGADVGGVMSLIPAFGAALVVFAGHRIGLRTVIALGATAVATVLVFAFIDAMRPEASHTHLARLADHVLDGRWDEFGTIISRRWQASFGSVGVAATAAVAAGMVAALAYVEWCRRRPDASPGAPSTTARTASASDAVDWVRRGQRGALAGLGVLAVVGLVANDSSIAVPMTTLIIAVPVHLVTVVRPPGEPDPRSSRGAAATVQSTSPVSA